MSHEKDRSDPMKARRLRRIRAGKYVRDMTPEEREVYVACCRQLGIEPKSPTTKENTSNGTRPRVMHEGDVVNLFGDTSDNPSTNRGDVIPPGGRSGEGELGDHRKRYNMKYAGRLGKRWSEIIQNVKDGEYTWSEFVEALSPEELARGQIKDKDGGWRGRPPEFVPRAFHDACIRELLARGKMIYKESYIIAIQSMAAIASSKTAKESDRIKAATFIVERIEGKVPDRVEVSAADPWQTIIGGIVGEVEDEAVARAQEYFTRREEVGGA
jgi:hypothetical protein